MTTDTCPSCGAERIPGATFCEACAHDFTADDAAAGVATPPPTTGVAEAAAGQPVAQAATPETAPPGDESPLDVGWTGRTVVGEAGAPQSATSDGAPTAAGDGS